MPPALPPFSTRQLELVLALDAHRHFGRAAAALGVHQSTVSRDLAELERALAVVLFDRGPRGVAPTPAGAALLSGLPAVVEALAERVTAAQGAARGEAGRLRLLLGPMTTLGALPAAIAALRAARPGLQLELGHASTRDQLAALLAGAADLGFSLAPPAHPELQAEQVEEHALVAVVPISDPTGPLALEALLRRPFVMMGAETEPGISAAFARLCAAASARPTLAGEVDHVEAMLALVAAGLGVSLAPSTIAAVLHPGARTRAVDPPLRTGVTALWPRRRGPTPAGATLLADLRGRAARRPA